MTDEQPGDGSGERLDRHHLLEVAQEEIAIEKREVVTGRIRVCTETDTIEEVVRQELRSTRAEVARIPIGRTLEPGETPPGPRSEGEVMIIPIFEEIMVVEKRLVLKEELHITQHTDAEDVETPVTLRKQRAVVERFGPDGEPEQKQGETYD